MCVAFLLQVAMLLGLRWQLVLGTSIGLLSGCSVVWVANTASGQNIYIGRVMDYSVPEG